jgi:hypothetical protein
LADSTAITSSSLETAPQVPPAPSGFDDPGGDPDTITSDPALTANSNGYIARIVPANSGIINTLGNLSGGEFVEFTSALQSTDIVGSVLRNDTDILTPPGVYQLTVMAEMQCGGTDDVAYSFVVNIKVYSSAGVLLDTYTSQAGKMFLTTVSPNFTIQAYLPITMTALISDPSMEYVRVSLDGSSTPDVGSSPWVSYVIRNVFIHRISTTVMNLQ